MGDRMKGMTYEEAIKLHREFWLRMGNIAESGIFPVKQAVLDDMGYEQNEVDCDCFLCEYGVQVLSMGVGKCVLCLAKWTETTVNTPCLAEDSLFSKYCDYREQYANQSVEMNDKDRDVVAQLCLDISNLPMRDKLQDGV